MKDGWRLPPVRSSHFTTVGVAVAVRLMTLKGVAQVPSYSLPLAGAHIPQVMRASAVWALSTSCGASVTLMVTEAAATPPSPAPVAVKVPWMSKSKAP